MVISPKYIVRKKQEFITLFRSQRDQLEVLEKEKTLKKSCTPTEECNLEFRPIGSQPIRSKAGFNFYSEKVLNAFFGQFYIQRYTRLHNNA